MTTLAAPASDRKPCLKRSGGCYRNPDKVSVSSGDCDAYVDACPIAGESEAALAGHRIMAYSI